MTVLSVGEIAAHLTDACGEYVSPHRVVAAIDRLVKRGELRERRAGRGRVLLEADLPLIEAEFGVTGQMMSGSKDNLGALNA